MRTVMPNIAADVAFAAYLTAEGDAAMARIAEWAMPVAERISRRYAPHLREDITAAELLALVEKLRAGDFAAEIDPVAIMVQTMRQEAAEAAGASDVIVIPRRQQRRYLAAVAEHGSIAAAVEAARAGGTGIRPETLLAVHFALTVADLDGGETAYHNGTTEDVERRELVAWLLGELPERQAHVVICAYGLSDDALDRLRLLKGLRPDEPLTDEQVGYVLSRSRSSVQTDRTLALAAMRRLLDDATDAPESAPLAAA